MNFILLYITCKNKDEAIFIGKSLVELKLAGCVNILEQMTSIYQWEGKLEIAQEVVLLVKTTENLYAEINSHVKEIHSYKVPCLLSIPIQNGNEEYLQWLITGMKSN